MTKSLWSGQSDSIRSMTLIWLAPIGEGIPITSLVKMRGPGSSSQEAKFTRYRKTEEMARYSSCTRTLTELTKKGSSRKIRTHYLASSSQISSPTKSTLMGKALTQATKTTTQWSRCRTTRTLRSWETIIWTTSSRCRAVRRRCRSKRSCQPWTTRQKTWSTWIRARLRGKSSTTDFTNSFKPWRTWRRLKRSTFSAGNWYKSTRTFKAPNTSRLRRGRENRYYKGW